MAAAEQTAPVRFAGVNIPGKKHLDIGLTHIFGVGRSSAIKICHQLGIEPSTKVFALSEEQKDKIRHALTEFEIEGDLRIKIKQDIQRLKNIRSYRGSRHQKGLPLKARTKTNARTRRGGRKLVIGKKK